MFEVKILSNSTGMLLSVPEVAKASSPIIVKGETDRSHQTWVLTPLSDGGFSLADKTGGLAVDAPSDAPKVTFPGKLLRPAAVMRNPNGGATQEWMLVSKSPGVYQIVLKSRNLALETKVHSKKGELVLQGERSNDPNQEWRIHILKVTADLGKLVTAVDGHALAAAENSDALRTSVVTDSPRQSWKFVAHSHSGKTFTIVNSANGKAISVQEGRNDDPILAEKNQSDPRQQWVITLTDNANICCVSKANGKAFVAAGALRLAPFDGGPDQQWRIQPTTVASPIPSPAPARSTPHSASAKGKSAATPAKTHAPAVTPAAAVIPVTVTPAAAVIPAAVTTAPAVTPAPVMPSAPITLADADTSPNPKKTELSTARPSAAAEIAIPREPASESKGTSLAVIPDDSADPRSEAAREERRQRRQERLRPTGEPATIVRKAPVIERIMDGNRRIREERGNLFIKIVRAHIHNAKTVADFTAGLMKKLESSISSPPSSKNPDASSTSRK